MHCLYVISDRCGLNCGCFPFSPNPPQRIYQLYNNVGYNCFIAAAIYVLVGAFSYCQLRLNKQKVIEYRCLRLYWYWPLLKGWDHGDKRGALTNHQRACDNLPSNITGAAFFLWKVLCFEDSKTGDQKLRSYHTISWFSLWCMYVNTVFI